MSGLTEAKDSDDEFHDAFAEVPGVKEASICSEIVANEASNTKCNSSHLKSDKEIIEEITRQQENLKLPDDDEEENDDAEQKSDKNTDELSKLFSDDIDIEELQNREKTMSSEELQQNKEESDRMKLEANELFKTGAAIKAVEIYTNALHICPTTYTKERAILYGNRAAAKINLDSKKSAIDDCTKAIEIWPDYVRALMRRAKLCENEDRLEDALADYKRVCELEPNQREARDAVSRLPEQINERNERLKTEMLSKLKDLGNMFLKPFGLSTENFQMQQDPNTGSYSVNFQQNNR